MIPKERLDRFCTSQPGPHAMGLWWLAQSGFVVRSDRATVVIDPFLGPNPQRAVPAPFAPENFSNVAVLACTHQHIDHFDPPSVSGIAAASPDAVIVVPKPIVSMVTDLGIAPNRVIGAQPGETISHGGATLHPVPACHGTDMDHAYSFGKEQSNGLYRFLGYVVEAGDLRVYHAGDTLVYDGMVETLRALQVNVALLPINGRDYFREAQNLVGNMNPREAADLTAKIGADLLVPMHYDMFVSNLGYPAHAVQMVRQYHSEVAVAVPSVQEPFGYLCLGG